MASRAAPRSRHHARAYGQRFKLALAVAAVAVYVSLPAEGPGTCPHHPESCYFSDGYEAARARFRQSAAKVTGARLHTLVIDERADLTVDVAIISPAEPSTAPPTLLHVSGTHGVEAYAGSAVQLALLRRWHDEPTTSPAAMGVRAVIVHALNPFGFRCSRRWNEQGADLNRNVLSEAEFADLARKGGERDRLYEKYGWLFNREHSAWTPFLDDLRFALTAAYGLAVHPYREVKRAIVSGQYHSPSKLYFGGGPKMARSHEALLELLRTEAAPASHAVFVDVHTGLGPTGVDSLMPTWHDAFNATDTARAIDEIFGQPLSSEENARGKDFLIDTPPAETQDDAAASAGYDLAVGNTGSYLSLMKGWASALHVTQEFGTRAPTAVLRGMVVENAEWQNHAGPPGSPCRGSPLGARAAQDVFYIRTASWQRKIVRRGMEVVRQAIAALSDPAALTARIPVNNDAVA
jgi:hypothetical protein